MKLKTYLKYSGIWFGFAVNPYHWQLKFQTTNPTDMDPAMYTVFLSVGPVWLRIIIDDGSY